jgi:hypothetical protein
VRPLCDAAPPRTERCARTTSAKRTFGLFFPKSSDSFTSISVSQSSNVIIRNNAIVKIDGGGSTPYRSNGIYAGSVANALVVSNHVAGMYYGVVSTGSMAVETTANAIDLAYSATARSAQWEFPYERNGSEDRCRLPELARLPIVAPRPEIAVCGLGIDFVCSEFAISARSDFWRRCLIYLVLLPRLERGTY